MVPEAPRQGLPSFPVRPGLLLLPGCDWREDRKLPRRGCGLRSVGQQPAVVVPRAHSLTFQISDWVLRPSLGGLWVAHPWRPSLSAGGLPLFALLHTPTSPDVCRRLGPPAPASRGRPFLTSTRGPGPGPQSHALPRLPRVLCKVVSSVVDGVGLNLVGVERNLTSLSFTISAG